jgi:hydroxymethylbilane synthase
LGAIDDPVLHRMIDTERAFLAELGGDCNVPCGALATPDGDAITVDALLASPDGRIVLRATLHGDDPYALGCAAARRLLDECGGRTLVEV